MYIKMALLDIQPKTHPSFPNPTYIRGLIFFTPPGHPHPHPHQAPHPSLLASTLLPQLQSHQAVSPAGRSNTAGSNSIRPRCFSSPSPAACGTAPPRRSYLLCLHAPSSAWALFLSLIPDGGSICCSTCTSAS